MPPTYWMISNRNVKSRDLGPDHAGLSFWVSREGRLDTLRAWTRVEPSSFREKLVRAASGFPLILDPAQHEQQYHVTLFVHGFNVNWKEAVRWYRGICRKLYSGPKGLGMCVLFTWPSDGMATNYFPDRIDARKSAGELAEVLAAVYDWLVTKQGETDPKKICRAKLSVIAHSMGNYVLQHAMQLAWTRKNQPLLVSLVNQLLMVAADVDNDLFQSGETLTQSDGDAIANLTYRVTALYTGRDQILGMSAGFKHFGKRRLGRSGLDPTVTKPDNVWDVDCSTLIPARQRNIHSAYFEAPKTIELMRQVLRGVDRHVLRTRRLAPRSLSA